MNHAPFVLATSLLLCFLTGCGDEKRSSPDVLQPPTGSGAVATDLGGTWRFTAVEPRLWRTLGGTNTDEAPVPQVGLMPPTVGTMITIAGHEFTDGNGLPLRREAFDRWTIVTSYINQVDDRFGIYTIRRHSDPSVADGASATLQMAMGTVDRDHLLGVIYHNIAGFMRAGELVEVMALVRLKRVP